MSYKEWTAIVQLAGGALVVVWLALDAADGGLGDGSPGGLAVRLLWAVAAIIAFNAVGMIVVAILVSVTRGEEIKDEPADERDEMVDTRSSRIGYAVTSALAALTLVPLAMGYDSLIAIVMLFIAPLAGGLAHAAAQLVYYRLG